MTDGRAMVGARKAALAKGRRKRVEFIVGSAEEAGQRAVLGRQLTRGGSSRGNWRTGWE